MLKLDTKSSFASTKLDVSLVLDNMENRQFVSENGSETNKTYIFSDNEEVSGRVEIKLKMPKVSVKHKGVTISLLGVIEQTFEPLAEPPFVCYYKEIVPPGVITEDKTCEFKFGSVELPYESYKGINTNITYYFSIIVVRRIRNNVYNFPVLVHNYAMYPAINNGMNLSIGLKNCLLLDLVTDKREYHLNEVILGRVTFSTIRTRIARMNITIQKKEVLLETTSDTPEIVMQNVFTMELLDGTPTNGETIPFRIFLEYIKLTPTYEVINELFSVSYYLTLEVRDENMRRFFKQEEIVFWRQPVDLGGSKPGGNFITQKLEKTESVEEPRKTNSTSMSYNKLPPMNFMNI